MLLQGDTECVEATERLGINTAHNLKRSVFSAIKSYRRIQVSFNSVLLKSRFKKCIFQHLMQMSICIMLKIDYF